MKRSSNNIRKVIIVTSIIVFSITLITSIYFLLKDFLAYKESNDESKGLQQEVIIKEENEEKVEIEWEKLEKINKDIIGWIKIAGTHINYPILQDKDNSKLQYLNKSFNGKYNVNGSIFTLNENPFQNGETIIYGHNMKSNIMFSELEQYMKKDFFYGHSNFEIYTKGQKYKATVFSCYSTNVYQEEKNIQSLEFDEKVEYYKKASKYSMENIGKVKKIVKLSTCSYLNNHTTPTNQRYYIVAKLEEID